ncbi:2-C-methyl-D-erythritol 4-phosphate cytidylyltransferase [Sulfobacillus harzensis]|uniref:2-C-methyl-D-erythritol 4-phosphate cytidylyltransferase n=1 Tax=Sulfobacillus harzensis TaxID=2729629 RepID=A0A7Y0L2L8_9FIRM|nr:2-C-methyl-D-erythritol 4-phosphate cytidylyltransferase [Sulfobacillus harzensis]NMP22163.1 2-C-methyl-D-erythritol 4-phosphate cytidylyltransferase [Sulfobacillus harzensis]
MEAEARVTDAQAIIVAAGQSRRMGGTKKIWMSFDSRTVLEWTLMRFKEAGVLNGVVVTRDEDVRRVQDLLAALHLAYAVTPGGEERFLSVQAGLRALPNVSPTTVVLVHDAARFLVPAELIRQVAEAARHHGAALPVLEVPDTVKRVDSEGWVAATVPRNTLRLAQTPQGFHKAVIEAAYSRLLGQDVPTDDAEVVERAGFPVMTIPGDPINQKLTRPQDVVLMTALLNQGGEPDAHRAGV